VEAGNKGQKRTSIIPDLQILAPKIRKRGMMDETIHKVCDDADEMGVRGGFAEGQSGEQMEESHRKMEDSDRNEVEGSLWDMSGTVLHVQGATDDNFQRSAEEVRTGIEALSKVNEEGDKDHVADARQESRAKSKESKEVRTSMAQARLAELEERLNRLQLKTSMLKTKPDEPVGVMPDNWALPGTVDERHSNIMSSTADNPATVRPQKRSVCYCSPFVSSHDLI